MPLHFATDIKTILRRTRNVVEARLSWRRFEHVESLLMDRATLLAHEAVWGAERDQVVHDLPRLNEAERSLFDDLRDNRIRPGLRLEQELVTFGWLKAALRSYEKLEGQFEAQVRRYLETGTC